MSMLAYTGVGSRTTPDSVLAQMRALGARLAGEGFTLRSGGADGADTAFEEGARASGGQLEIYLPWAHFNGHQTGIVRQSLAAEALASTVHPAWAGLSPAARRLHVRNCHQVLGLDLLTPSLFVVCWTPDGCTGARSRTRATGGTATAIVVAERYAVPVFNLHDAGTEARLERALRAATARRWEAFAQDEPVAAE
jgi:hypothetical protein